MNDRRWVDTGCPTMETALDQIDALDRLAKEQQRAIERLTRERDDLRENLRADVGLLTRERDEARDQLRAEERAHEIDNLAHDRATAAGFAAGIEAAAEETRAYGERFGASAPIHLLLMTIRALKPQGGPDGEVG